MTEKDNAAPDHINVKVQDQSGSTIHFRIKKNTSLKKLMNAYCDRMGLRTHSVRFLFDGYNVQESDTPAGLDMEEGDTVEVFHQQTGGS